MNRRVVVTGMGVISPLGNGLESFRGALREGRSGLGTITRFNTSRFPVKKAFEVRNFHPKSHGTHLLDPFIQYAVAASEEAVLHAQFDSSRVDPYRIGISVSSSKGGMYTIERFKERLQETPSAILGARVYTSAVPNFAAQWIARRWKIKGAAKCYVAACATGTVAVSEGVRMVSDGTVDYCIAGASDASIVPLLLAAYRNMKVLGDENMYPFDRRRKGFLAGEGAGIVFLETLESAKARGAKIYGEVLGFQYGCDPTDGLHFKDDENALARTLQGLTSRLELSPSDLDYVNLHGTATPEGDLYETRQMKQAFGKKAYHIPMSSTKSMTGHMLGASGAVEIIASLAAMEDGFLPPTIHLEQPDPECDLDYVALRARKAAVRTAVSVSMGFGGHIAAIALGKR